MLLFIRISLLINIFPRVLTLFFYIYNRLYLYNITLPDTVTVTDKMSQQISCHFKFFKFQIFISKVVINLKT